MIHGLGRSPREGNGNPVKHYCLGNPMDRGAWRATVHGVPKESDTEQTVHEELSVNPEVRKVVYYLYWIVT